MRFIAFTNGLQTFVTTEEQELIKQISKQGSAKKRDLTEREQEVARHLTQKSILTRQKVNDSIYFKLSKATNPRSTY